VRIRIARRSLARAVVTPMLALLLVVGANPAAAHAQVAYARNGTLAGIDVSHWQGKIGWQQVRAAGVQFAIAKATEGRLYVDPRYLRNRARAGKVGVVFGAYHFARPDWARRDAKREADFFVDNAYLRGRHLLPVLDLETSGGLSSSALTSWVRSWLARVEARLGVKPMIYTSPAFWKDHLGNTTWFAANGYQFLWVAHWGADSPSVPAKNWNGYGWSLWQLSNCGSVAGVAGCVDVDLYDGTNLSRLLIRNNR
jgi:lysozyme